MLNMNEDENWDTVVQSWKVAFHKLSYQMQRGFRTVMRDLGGQEILEKAARWCVRHPTMAVAISAILFVIVLGVGISMFIMMFTGFLVLKGLLILLLCWLGMLIFTSVFFVAFGTVIYLGLARNYDIFGSVNHYRRAIVQYLATESIQQNEQNIPREPRQNKKED